MEAVYELEGPAAADDAMFFEGGGDRGRARPGGENEDLLRGRSYRQKQRPGQKAQCRHKQQANQTTHANSVDEACAGLQAELQIELLIPNEEASGLLDSDP